MAEKTINELPAATSVTATDQLPIDNGTSTLRATMLMIKTYIQTAFGSMAAQDVPAAGVVKSDGTTISAAVSGTDYIVVTGTPTVGQVIRATGSTTAEWQDE